MKGNLNDPPAVWTGYCRFVVTSERIFDGCVKIITLNRILGPDNLRKVYFIQGAETLHLSIEMVE